jgi:type IV secretory pathway VirB2 component (pilin)
MKKSILLLVIILLVLTNVDSSFAALSDPVSEATSSLSGGSMATVLCNVLGFVTGTVGKTLASFTIIGVGLGFFSGKVSWGAMIGVTLGISALFGSPAIIRAVTGGGDICGRS